MKNKILLVIAIIIAIVVLILGVLVAKKVSESSVQTSGTLNNLKETEIYENLITLNTIELNNNVIENNTIENNTTVNNTVSENNTVSNNTTTNTTTNNTTTKNTTTSNTTTNTSTKNTTTNTMTKNTTTKSTTTTTTKKDTVSVATTEGKKGVIYLTFDDGPSTSTTPKILDVLKQEGVKATFFILNYNSEGEKIVKREYEEGHAIGIHGYSHTYSAIYQTEDTYMNNLNKLQDKIKKSLGITTWITRFPGGSSNTVSRSHNQKSGLMSRLVKLVQEKGYKYYDWNVDSNDAGGANTKTQVYNNVIKGLSKNRPNVVLMHDIKTATTNAIKDIIQYGKKNGYTFEVISADSNLVMHHNVNN